ncbi:hypothetical protein BU24DRAFT_463353 [Aaosphaeria arxii CBS 175.79]|uniref:Uncharacterized protein n=1 Tax=Aaosphaeria arxii CBS 175.79 TaxID=1450172 RepID=A0A6A5XNQ8_9PLEO|nr:uncharacterized protein BU24DRAFT_463353 [Aaosphaeria arxii CBS 175.79]KAF2014573.1 hypothetical protein BU24DRAFT_463353 [Aaosphaeria arxii CBS 175.79]
MPRSIGRSQMIASELPTELREIIYSYLLQTDENPIFPFRLYVLSMVSNATRRDAWFYFLRTHASRLGHHEARRHYIYMLGFLGEQGFAAARRLIFSQFSAQVPRMVEERNPNIDLILRCTGLRKVWLQWSTRQLLGEWRARRFIDLDQPPPRVDCEFYTLEEVIQRLRLQYLLESKSLEVIVLALTPATCVLRPGVEKTIQDATVLLQELKVWICEGFRSRGRIVEVTEPLLATWTAPHPAWEQG